MTKKEITDEIELTKEVAIDLESEDLQKLIGEHSCCNLDKELKDFEIFKQRIENFCKKLEKITDYFLKYFEIDKIHLSTKIDYFYFRIKNKNGVFKKLKELFPKKIEKLDENSNYFDILFNEENDCKEYDNYNEDTDLQFIFWWDHQGNNWYFENFWRFL